MEPKGFAERMRLPPARPSPGPRARRVAPRPPPGPTAPRAFPGRARRKHGAGRRPPWPPPPPRVWQLGSAMGSPPRNPGAPAPRPPGVRTPPPRKLPFPYGSCEAAALTPPREWELEWGREEGGGGRNWRKRRRRSHRARSASPGRWALVGEGARRERAGCASAGRARGGARGVGGAPARGVPFPGAGRLVADGRGWRSHAAPGHWGPACPRPGGRQPFFPWETELRSSPLQGALGPPGARPLTRRSGSGELHCRLAIAASWQARLCLAA